VLFNKEFDMASDNTWWVEQQRRTFTQWFNARVKDVDVGGTTKPIEDIQNDLDDGVQLCRLMAGLYNLYPPPGLSMKPKNPFEKRENILCALKHAENAGVKAPLTKETHFVEHDLRMILGFTWSCILHYSSSQFQGPGRPLTSSHRKSPSASGPQSPASSGRGGGLKDALLQYCRGCLAGTGIPMDNFTSHWSDGRAFLGLLHHHDNEIVPDFKERCAEPVSDIDQRKRNLEDAFAAAERIGAPRLLLVDDVAEDPDEHSVMTYVAELHSAFETDKAAREREAAAAAERANNQAKLDRTEAELEQAKQLHKESSVLVASKEKEAADAREKLAEAEKDKDRLAKELAEEKAKNEKLNKELADEKAGKDKLGKDLEDEKAENERLRKELEDQRKKEEEERKKREEEDAERKRKEEEERKKREEEDAERKRKEEEERKKREEEEAERKRKEEEEANKKKEEEEKKKEEEPPKEEPPKEEPPKNEDDAMIEKALLAANVALTSFLSGTPHLVLGGLAMLLLCSDMFPAVANTVNGVIPPDQRSVVAMGNMVAALAALLIL